MTGRKIRRGDIYYADLRPVVGCEQGGIRPVVIGIYEGAFPHIGEACFQVKAERKCSSYDEAFQKACELGGIKFLMDLFSSGQVPQEPTQGMHL